MTGPVFPEDSWVEVQYPLTREQEHGDRAAWPWLPGWIAGLVLLYALRFALAAPETARGLRRMVLSAAPLPAPPQTPAPEAIEHPATKKAVLLALYRAHPGYGDRSRASRVAAELAARAGLQAGTARSYLYAELDGKKS